MKPTQRDHGYAWVILCASFINNMLAASTMMSIAVYMVDWIEEFQSTKAEVGLAGSMFAAGSCITGLFMGPLNERLGCRVVTIIGACIMVVGLIITSFATSLMWLYISYSIITGFGLGMCFLPPMIIVQFYFDKKRALASGISLAGHSMGTFTMMPLLRLLVQTYGWKGAILIQAGISLNIIVTALLYTPPVGLKSAKNNSAQDTAKTQSKLTTCSNAVFNFFKTNWDIKLFKNPVFVQFFLAMVLCLFSGEIMYKFTPVKAAARGVSKIQTSLLPSIIGLTSTTGRIITSIVSNLKCVNRTVLSGSAITISGVATIASGFTFEFISLAVSVGIYGVALGTQMTLVSTVLVDLIGLSGLVQGQSFLAGGMGCAMVIALTLAGFITDKTQSFDIPYYIYGSITALGGLIMLSIPVTQRRMKKKQPLHKDHLQDQKDNSLDDKRTDNNLKSKNYTVNNSVEHPDRTDIVYASMQSLTSIP